MTELKPVERSLYTYISKLLENLGFQGVTEAQGGDDYIDIYFKDDEQTFIVEIKIDKPGKNQVINGIVQAYRYSLNHRLGTRNIISICYPKDVVGYISNFKDVSDKALKRRVECILLTENWYEYVTDLSVEEIFSSLKAKIDRKVLAAQNIHTASKTIEKAIRQLSILINKSYGTNKKDIEHLADFLGDYGLLLAFNRTTNERILRNQIIDLLAYILVNQILFYFLYAKKTKSIPEIQEITELSDLKDCFKNIQKINFRPIYDINVTSKILNTPEIIEWVNTIISCLAPLRIDELKHDLYGRLIGNSLPKETRKTLASYYTLTSSADILANLSIDDYNNTVWDLACGSGTILVSAYNRKLRLLEILKSLNSTDKKKWHRIFLEKEMTGTDIMPFACHLTGLNLSAQNLDALTNHMRIVNKNSLVLHELPIEVNEAYGDIYKELESIKPKQRTLEAYQKKEKEEIIKLAKITLEKVERVLINPPFTRLTNLPKEYRKAFSNSTLSDICGNRINLWGYFLALSDKVLIDGGKLGAIIPLSILRGEDTKALRKYFLENYSIEYIIKPDFNLSFSEDASFGDVIFIAKKNKPHTNHNVKVVCLKKNISGYSSPDVEALASKIKTETENLSDDEEYLLRKVRQTELLDNLWNLMPYVFTNNKTTVETFDDIINKMKRSKMFIYPDENDIRDGIQLRPKGVARSRIITRKLSDNRILNANLIFDQDDNDEILDYSNKNSTGQLTIHKTELTKSFRSITSVKSIEITSMHDYFIHKDYGVSVFSHLVIPMRYRLNSEETYATAFYHDEGIFPTNSFFMYMNLNKEQSKILALYFNSVFYIIQLLRMRKQATYGFLEIKQIDILRTYLPSLEKLNETSKDKLFQIYDVFNKNPTCIISQFKDKPQERVELDCMLSHVLNLKITKEDILKIYDLVSLEIDNFGKNVQKTEDKSFIN